MEQKSIPLYQQVASEIIKRINNGEFPKGGMIASEFTVQQEYNVSRVTVRKAYKTLIDKGILRTIPGKGTYVNDIDTKDWTWMNSFSQEVLASGHFPTTRIVKMKQVNADNALAQRLGVEQGTPCYYLKRVRYIDNKPVWLTKSYFPCAMAPGLTPEYFSVAGVAQSIFRVIEMNFGYFFFGGDEVQEAINIQAGDAKLLELEENKPVISKAFIARDRTKKYAVYENTIFAQSISRHI